MNDHAPTRALVIRDPWVSLILSGEKTWEMRRKDTARRGSIALIKSGSGTIVGVADLVDVLGPFNDAEIVATVEHHRVPLLQIDDWRRAWVLRNAQPLSTPLPYVHRLGAVDWVVLDEKTRERLRAALSPETTPMPE
jgi:hypothetical protein